MAGMGKLSITADDDAEDLRIETSVAIKDAFIVIDVHVPSRNQTISELQLLAIETAIEHLRVAARQLEAHGRVS